MAIQTGSIEVEFRANLDNFRDGMAEAEQTARQSAESIQANSQGLKKVFDGIGEKAAEEFGQFADAAFEAFDKANASAAELRETVSGIGQSLKTIGFGALQTAAAGATFSLVKMAKAGVADTASLEKTQIQMQGLTHSIEAGNKAMAMAVQYYKNNPFNRFEVTDATKNLIQFGASLEEIPALLDKMGKVSLSTGASIDQLSYIYQRMISDGRINTLDLLQLQTQGVAIFDALGKRLGTTAAGVRELVAQGKVSIEDVKEAFNDLVDEDAMESFNKTLDRQIGRAQGRLSDFKGALAGYFTDEINGITVIENSIYEKWTAFLKKFADLATSSGGSATDIGKNIVSGFQKISLAVGNVIDKLTQLVEPALNIFGKLLNFIGDNAETMIPIIGAALLAFTNVARIIPGIGSIVEKVSGAFRGLNIDISALIKKHWGLIAVVGLLVNGFIQAYKTDEEFRQTIQDLFSALGELGKSLSEVVKTILPALVEVFKEIAGSDAVKSILKGVASALKGIAQAISSIPPDNLAGIIAFIAAFKLMNTNPILLAVSAIGLLIAYFKELADQGENLPDKLLEIGHNMMTGLLNGIIEGSKKVIQFVKDFASTVVNSIKSLLKIHSPSQVMYEVGENITLGLANGITDSSNVVQVAMNNLAKDILSLSNKVIKNKVDFGILDIKQEYQEWKKVSKLFTEGSEQYNSAIEKMEDARKSANLQILALQQTYNDTLDDTIDRISNMYGLFDEVSLGNSTNSNKILKTLDKQIAKMSEWAEAQEIIRGMDLDEALKAELAAMGITQVSELEAIANMTSDELSALNDMWLYKQDIANKAGVAQMEGLKNDTLEQIRELKRGIEGETVDIADVGGRLVESISEGITGALPTLEDAYSQLGEYIAAAQKAAGETDKSGDGGGTGDIFNTQKALDEVKGNLAEFGTKLKDMLPKVLLGIVGALGLKKILSWVGSKLLSGGTISQGISGLVSSLADTSKISKGGIKSMAEIIVDQLFAGEDEGTLKQKIISGIQDRVKGLDPKTGLAKATQGLEQAKESVVKTSGAAKTVSSTSESISTSVSSVSQNMSKASSLLGTIKEGAQTVIWIAGAIAAVGVALWAAYSLLKDIDFLKLQVVLLEMAEAVVAMGALAWAAGKIKIGITDILMIAGVAADVAIVALACRVAYWLMSGIDFVQYQVMLLEMIEALVAIGGLGALLGLFSPIAGPGILMIIGVAIDIVALGRAIADAYAQLSPIDFDSFNVVLLMMIEALATFGGFQAILGVAAILEGLGWLAVLSICGSIAEVAKACGFAYEQMKDIEYERFGQVIELMQNALRSFSGFQALLGILAPLEFLGWAGTIAVCGSITEVAKAMKTVYENVPDDIETTNKKIDQVQAVLRHISKVDLKQVIGAIVLSWSVEPVKKIMGMYEEVAKALNRMQDVYLDDEKIMAALTEVQKAVTQVREHSGTINSLMQLCEEEANAQANIAASNVIVAYADVVDALNKIAGFKVADNLFSTLDSITSVVQHIRTSTTTMWSFFGSGVGQFNEDLNDIKDIVKKFLDLLPDVKDLMSDDYKIDKQTALDRIKDVEAIVWQIGESGTGGWIESKAKDLREMPGMVENFKSIVKSTQDLVSDDYNLDWENAKTRIKKVEEVIYQIGECGTGGWIESKEKDLGLIQSIVNKFTEIIPVAAQVADADFNGDWVKERIEKVNQAIKKIGDAPKISDASDKEWSVGMAASIVGKLGEFIGKANDLDTPDEGKITSAINSLNTILNTSITKISGSMQEFEQVGMDFVLAVARGATQATDVLEMIGANIQGGIWRGIENKMQDEVAQGAWLANRFAEGVKSVDMSNVGADMQGAIWRGIQDRIEDEYHQGKTLGERFRQGLYDVDYANAGWWAVQGFIDGAWNKANGSDGVHNAGYWVADKFLQGLRDRGQQGSPWKTTMESGTWAVEGLIDGIKGSEKALVGEATSLADEVIEALTMDDITLSPELDARGTYTPTMTPDGGYGYGGGGRDITINQNIEAYSQLDMEQISRDLAWNLSTI